MRRLEIITGSYWLMLNIRYRAKVRYQGINVQTRVPDYARSSVVTIEIVC